MARDVGVVVVLTTVLVILPHAARAAAIAPTTTPSPSPAAAWRACECPETSDAAAPDLDGLLCNVTDTATGLTAFANHVKHRYLSERFNDPDMGEDFSWLNLPGLPRDQITSAVRQNATITRVDIVETFQYLLYFLLYVEQAAQDEVKGAQTQVGDDFATQYSHIRGPGLRRLLCTLKSAADAIGLDVTAHLSREDPMGYQLRSLSNIMHRNMRDIRLLIDLSQYMDYVARVFSFPMGEDICKDCRESGLQSGNHP